MAAPFRCRVLAITPIIARRLLAPSLAPRICPHIERSDKINDHRISLSSGIVPARLYSASSQEAYDDTEDDILYKKLLIEVKGHDPTIIDSYEKFVTMAARELDVNIVEIKTPPKVIERYTQLKSVHIYKKHRVQYETRTHFRSLTVKHVTGSTADTFLEYIQRNLPEGMAMKVTKHRIEQLPAHITPPPQESTI